MAGALLTSANLAARRANFSAISGSVVLLAVLVGGLLLVATADGDDEVNDLNLAALASSTDLSATFALDVFMTMCVLTVVVLMIVMIMVE